MTSNISTFPKHFFIVFLLSVPTTNKKTFLTPSREVKIERSLTLDSFLEANTVLILKLVTAQSNQLALKFHLY